MKSILLSSLLATSLVATFAFGEDLTCLTDQEREQATLYSQLQREAYAALDRRLERYEQLKTAEQIRAYQRELREFFVKQLGGLPPRTPLNAKTVRTIDADGYRIENVIFDSQPHHHVTANLYLPKVNSPVPGVVVSSGHSRTAKTADYNQRFGIMMAKQGMAALCFDPIGQGERSQILTADGKPKHGGTTTEHFLIGVGSTLVGRNTARYRIWDAMRAIDYIADRPEVDAQRIGLTGCSGGGTLTSYVMALDDRVACAAPACYLTTFRRLIETIGPQDAEQNIYGQISFGMDQPDYVLMRAPKPTLISSTTGDFFDIDGSWDNYRQAKRIYTRLGYPERVDLVEADGKHGVQPQNLATIAHWMNRWLLGKDAPVDIAELQTREPEELWCTETGQVLDLPGELSVFDLNAEYAAELSASRSKTLQAWTGAELSSKIRRLLALAEEPNDAPPEHEDRGRVERDGYHIDKLVLKSESGVLLPALTFHPESPREDAYLYLHDEGKIGDTEVGGPVEQLVDDGYVVVTLDMRGQGETATGKRDPLLTDWKTYYLAYLLGKPLLGIRAQDVSAAARFIVTYQTTADQPRKVHLVAAGRAGIVALHAAALDPTLFESVTLRGTTRDWSAIVQNPSPSGLLDSVVHGALAVYDLPDLVRLAGEDKVRWED